MAVFFCCVSLSSVFIIAYGFLPIAYCLNFDGSLIDIYDWEGNLYRNDLTKTAYHLHKRSTGLMHPIKKAISVLEKKPIGKSIPISNHGSLSKKHQGLKNSIEETTTIVSIVNTTEESSTSPPDIKFLKEKYEVNNTSPSPPNNISSSDSDNATTSTSTTTNLTSITVSEALPTEPSTIKNKTIDHHVYYNSTFYMEDEEAMTYWVNLDEYPKNKIITHHLLSDSHRRAATVTLSFDFPFYGHLIRNITIATGGFLYTGDYIHSWLAATQYVAPLMANFDTSLSNESTVRYFDNGTAFIIEWNQVTLQDEKQGRNFTFQATLFDNGNIVFVYQSIPVPVTEIGDEAHPVKVGLSDAYIIDKIVYFIRRKTIYEYHRIDMKTDGIANNTAIYFTALETCLDYKSCNSCIKARIGLKCGWCHIAKRCSDGLDRYRQDWLIRRCDEKNFEDCSVLPASATHPVVQPYTVHPPKTYTMQMPSDTHDLHEHPADSDIHHFSPNFNYDDEVIASHVRGYQQGPVGVGGVVAILLVLAVLLGVAAWLGYAYRNPHTSSGQLLIRYRPSQWRFRSGEARYTAASVHM